MKKNNSRKTTAAILATLIAVSSCCSGVYGATFGSELQKKSIWITNEAELINGVHYSSAADDRMAENYITYAPGGQVRPMVVYGNDIHGAASFKTVISYAKAAGHRVIAAINADYFTMANGVALGMVIQDGVIKTSESSSSPTVGFMQDGSAVISRTNLNVRVSSPALSNGLAHVSLNKVATKASGVILYTDAYHDTNKMTEPTVNVLINVTEGEPRINGFMDGVVESVTEATGATEIPDGKVLLTMTQDSAYPGTLAQIRGMQPGDQVTFSFEADAAWNDVVMAVGGGEKLLTKGINVAPTKNERAPRTVLGIREDGSVLFYTVDGRQKGHSAGATLQEAALRMLELGCVEAVNMDGGGSTAVLALYPGENDVQTINKPSGGTLRNCGNYILLVKEGKETGVLANLHLYPYSSMMLAKAKQKFTIKATDTNSYPMQPPADLTFEMSQTVGTIDADGLFTAGEQAGKSKIVVRGGGAYGETDVMVVTNPHTIGITNGSTGQSLGSSVTVQAGSTFQFSGSASYNQIPLIAQGQCFDWSVTGGIGTIDENGHFTSANISKGTGTVTASVAGKTASVTVNISSEGERIADFESDLKKFETGTFGGLTSTIETDLGKVKSGRRSLRISYGQEETVSAEKDSSSPESWLFVEEESADNVTEEAGDEAADEAATSLEPAEAAEDSVSTTSPEADGSTESEEGADYEGNALSQQTDGAQRDRLQDVASLPAHISFSKAPTMMSYWLYGNGSGVEIRFSVETPQGTKETESTVVDFSGWKQIRIPLPKNTKAIGSLNIHGVKAEGTIYIDHVMAGYGHYLDEKPPVITLSVENQMLSAKIQDDLDTGLVKDRISVMYDGKKQDFSYDVTAGLVSATLPEADGKAHRVSVTAEDLSGHVARASLTIAAEEKTEPFSDMKGHWAAEYTGYLYDQKIISGQLTASGKRTYLPDKI